jgi:hypothetical protein
LRCRLLVAVGLLSLLGSSRPSRADAGGIQDTRDLARTGAASGSLASKFQGSVFEASTFVGTGTFYASGYHDPYVSLGLLAMPTYDLGTRYQLSLNGRFLLETEFTKPDNPEGRHYYPYDAWIWLSARNLHTFETSKIRVGGVVRTLWPLSYESRYQNMLFGIGGGPNVSREFELRPVADTAKRWTLTLTYSTYFIKYVQSSEVRGSMPGASSGCRVAGTGGIGGEAPSTPDADRCGGPINPNFSLWNIVGAKLVHGPWSLAASLVVINVFEYGIPADAMTATAVSGAGRTDTTWGIVALSYQLRPHLALVGGTSSLQPALDAENRNLRFPFFDLSSGRNANNFTQFFFGVDGVL